MSLLGGAFKAGSIVGELKLDKSGWNQSIRSVGQDKKTLTGAAGQITSGFSNVAKSILAVGIAYFGSRGIHRLASSFLEVASSTEQFRLRLETLLGSQEKAAAAMEFFRETAAKVPFTLQEVIESGTTLTAMGANLKTWTPILTDLAAVMGMKLPEAASALGRAFAGGAGAADIFRERGILQIIKDSARMKHGIDDITKLSLPQFRKMMLEAFSDPDGKIAGAADKLATTWKGIISMLQDKWFQFRDAVMKAGVFEILKKALADFNKKLDEFIVSGKLDEWAFRTAQNIIKAMGLIKSGFRGLVANVHIVRAAFNTLLLDITKGLMNFIRWQMVVYGVLAKMAPNKFAADFAKLAKNYIELGMQAKLYAHRQNEATDQAAEWMVALEDVSREVQEYLNKLKNAPKKIKDFTNALSEPGGMGEELAKVKTKVKDTALLVSRDFSKALKYATTYLIRVRDYTGKTNRELDLAHDNFRKLAEVLETDATTAFTNFYNILQMGLNLLFMAHGGPMFPLFQKVKTEMFNLKEFWKNINDQIKAEWIRGLSGLITNFKNFLGALNGFLSTMFHMFADTIAAVVVEWVKGTITMKQAVEGLKQAVEAFSIFFAVNVMKGLLTNLGILKDQADEEVDAILKKLDEAKKKGEEVWDVIRKIQLEQSEAGTRVRSDKTRQGTDYTGEISADLQQWIDKLPAGLKAMIDFRQSPRMLMRLGRIARASLGLMMRQGYSLFEALTALKEPLTELQEKYEKLGQTAPRALQPMLDMIAKMNEKPGLFKGMSGLLDVFNAFVKSGYMTQQLFKDLTANAQSFVRKILGVSGNLRKAIGNLSSISKEQIMMLAPIIAPFLEAAQKFGLKLPGWIKDLAKKTGIKIEEQPIAEVPGKLDKIHERIGKQGTRLVNAIQGLGRRLEKALGAIPGQEGLDFYSGTHSGLVRYHPREQISVVPDSFNIQMSSTPIIVKIGEQELFNIIARHSVKQGKRGRYKISTRSLVGT